MKYLSLLIIVLLTISSVLSQDVYCEIDYTIPWSSQGCKSTSDYTSTCSSMYFCLDLTGNLTQKLQNAENTYIILKTDNYDPIDDCVGNYNGFPTSVNVIFETTMDYVNIQCKEQQMYIYILLEYPINLYFNNMHFKDLVSQNSPINIYYSPSQFDAAPSNVYFSNIIVTNSQSVSGGFLITDRYNVNIINSIFINCKATYGGAIYSTGSNTTVSIIDSSFTGCYAYNIAGAIFASNNIFTQNSTFSKNGCAYNEGGALNAMNIVNVVNSTFDSNFVTEGEGGAISSGKSIYINNSLFFENNASSGGAVSGFDVYVEKSTFINNQAVGMGGAITTTNLFTIIGSNFESNTADSGGAVGSGVGSIEKSTFYRNTAVNYGGAIYLYIPFAIRAYSFWDSSFTSNNAQYGGAIYAKGNIAFDLSNSLFLYNHAIKEAGSFYFSDPQKSNKIVGGTFVNSTCRIIGATQTFNSALIKIFGSVYVSSSLVNPGSQVYSVPLAFDVSTAPYARAYETNAKECSNGVATIDLNGDVTGCTCFTGYTGPHCT